MSDHGFHVHGPHDHELEHAQQGGHGEHGGEQSGLVNQVALFTAIIATIGSIFGYMGGATQSDAGLYKNNAAIQKTEANDKWNFYQAKSTKQSLAEMAVDLSTRDEDKAKYKAKAERYDKEKAEILEEAKKLEKISTEWDEKSEEKMHQHHRWAQSTTVLQVCIALAAIALLTKKKWLQYAMYGAGGIGLAVGAFAAFHI